jgi:hypothetical protein
VTQGASGTSRCAFQAPERFGDNLEAIDVPQPAPAFEFTRAVKSFSVLPLCLRTLAPVFYETPRGGRFS